MISVGANRSSLEGENIINLLQVPMCVSKSRPAARISQVIAVTKLHHKNLTTASNTYLS